METDAEIDYLQQQPCTIENNRRIRYLLEANIAAAAATPDQLPLSTDLPLELLSLQSFSFPTELVTVFNLLVGYQEVELQVEERPILFQALLYYRERLLRQSCNTTSLMYESITIALFCLYLLLTPLDENEAFRELVDDYIQQLAELIKSGIEPSTWQALELTATTRQLLN